MLTQAFAPIRKTDFAAEVRVGLCLPGQKELPSKYLYDDVGSALFEVICLLPEYGLCRAGARLLQRHAEDVVARLQAPTIVAELGNGTGKKTRHLLEALSKKQPTTYCPIDISASAMVQCARELSHIASVSVVGFEQAYLDGLIEGARRRTNEQLLVLFLGSTIGNFDCPAGDDFLRHVGGELRSGDCLLLATDLMKPVPQLLRAYDDALGVTRAFNLNLLARVNRVLGAVFDLSRFQHLARWDPNERRVEMHLRSTEDQEVHIPGAALRVRFRAGEIIWTESAHKYTSEKVTQMAGRTGYHCDAQWVDEEWPFAQSLLRVL